MKQTQREGGWGADSLRDLPDGWDLPRLRFISSIEMGQSPPSAEYSDEPKGPPFLQGNAEFGDRHPTPKVYCHTARKHAGRGDLLLSVRAPVGALNVADQNYGIGRGLCAIRPSPNQFNPAFAHYAVQAARPQLHAVATGSTYDAVSTEDVGNAKVLLPDVPLQNAIADFLDRKTEGSDALIRKKERLIGLLEEKRKALITRVVTEGLDPDVPMKNSGIEWLGTIPKSWPVAQIKRLARSGRKTFTDGDWVESPYITDAGVRLIQTGNIGTGRYKEQGFRYISRESFRELGCTEIEPGDILICRLADPVGRACRAPDLDCRMITAVDVAILKPPPQHDPRFLTYFFSSRPYLERVQALCRGGTRDRVSRSMLGDIHVAVPPREAQRRIADYLDEASERSLQLSSMLDNQITKLREYRQALIFAAVTGKIDVRADVPEPEDALAEVPA